MKASFNLLGPLEVMLDGRSVALGAPKQRAALVELLLRRGEVVSRAALIDALWPDAPPASALAAVQVYVHGLRRALGAERIETRNGGYLLGVAPGEVDLDRFEALVARGEQALAVNGYGLAAEDLRAALALRRGAPLAELEEPSFVRGRSAIERRVVEAVELFAEAELAVGRHELVLLELEAAIEAHRYRERLREQQMLALYRAGRPTEALAAYQAARAALDEVGLEPGLALRTLEAAILRNDESLAAPEPTRVPHSIPVVPTSLVGREDDVASLLGLLRRPDVRLTTLTGPGGIGKTRLALAAAQAIAGELVDGAVFVDLAPVSEAERVRLLIAEGVGLVEGATSLSEHLAGRSLLLVIDNFEQVISAAEQIGQLLSTAPRLRVLVTSRVPLRLTGEHVFLVEPLPVPSRGLPSYAELCANPAVQLFVERATAVDPRFELTVENVAFVAEVCRRLDGLPLAIELAAGRTPLLSPARIVALLGGALDVLSDDLRDRPPRQQTLRATLDWSHDLLAPAERRALATLSVFVDGFSAEAAAAVIDRPRALLGELSALAQANLIQRLSDSQETRFAMLETVRAYAAEQLAAHGEEGDPVARHANYFLEWAESPAVQEAAAGGSAAALDQLEAEIENARAALRTFAERGQHEHFARLALALRQYWLVRGHLNESSGYFEKALEQPQDTALRAELLVNGAIIPFRQGTFGRAKELWREALELYEQLGDGSGASRCHGELAAVAVQEGDLDAASAGFLRCTELFEQEGQMVRLGIALANLAAIESMRGDYATSASYGERAVALQTELNDMEGLAFSTQNLAGAYSKLGLTDQANAMLNRCLDVTSALGYRELLGYAFATAAALSGAHDPESAARLIGAAEALFSSVGAEVQDSERDAITNTMASLIEELGTYRYNAAISAGAAAPVEEMVRLARC